MTKTDRRQNGERLSRHMDGLENYFAKPDSPDTGLSLTRPMVHAVFDWMHGLGPSGQLNAIH
jgi:hypothetical protein